MKQNSSQAAVTLPGRGTAVLAPQSGGCARYVLSRKVAYQCDAGGAPTLYLDHRNETSLRLLTHSTVTLMVEDVPAPGEAIHVTGLLTPLDDHRFRLDAQRTDHVLNSGQKIAL